MCAYENAWSVNSRPGLCAAFTTEDLKESLITYIFKLQRVDFLSYIYIEYSGPSVGVFEVPRGTCTLYS